MFHHQLKEAFNSALENVSSRISSGHTEAGVELWAVWKGGEQQRPYRGYRLYPGCKQECSDGEIGLPKYRQLRFERRAQSGADPCGTVFQPARAGKVSLCGCAAFGPVLDTLCPYGQCRRFGWPAGGLRHEAWSEGRDRQCGWPLCPYGVNHRFKYKYPD